MVLGLTIHCNAVSRTLSTDSERNPRTRRRVTQIALRGRRRASSSIPRFRLENAFEETHHRYRRRRRPVRRKGNRRSRSDDDKREVVFFQF